MTTNYTTKLKNKRIISINGDESDIFLNNIITNDIKKIDNNSAIYSCLLTPQGKVISHFFIVKNNVEILVIIDDYLADEFIEKLNVYKLRSKVEINLKNEYEIIFSLSDNLKIKSIIEFNDPRNKSFGKYFIVNQDDQFQINFDTNDFYLNFLIKNNLIDTIFRNIKDQYFSLELNMKEFKAIDFSKGCYVGQENTSRMNLKNKISKRILQIESKSDLTPNEELKFENEIIGKILTSKPNFALIKMKNFDLFINKHLSSNSCNDIRIIKPSWLN